jgi:hypothetical protein
VEGHKGLRVSIKDMPDEVAAAGEVFLVDTEDPVGRVSWGEFNTTTCPLLCQKPATPPGQSVVATVNRPTAGSPTKSARKALTHTTSSGIRLSAAALAAAGERGREGGGEQGHLL